MIQLELTENEAVTLANVLDYYVSELRMEIADTEEKRMRDELKIEEDVLKEIAQTLRERLANA